MEGMETKQDTERRERLREWFMSDPEAWKDIEEELKISLSNELTQLKNRTTTNREWSSGYVFSHEFLLSRKDYFKKIWKTPIERSK